jgi:hypothetical protein
VQRGVEPHDPAPSDLDEALGFLYAPSGRAAAAAELRRRRLPTDLADDLIQNVAHAFERKSRRGDSVDEPAALARRMLRDAATDLVRSTTSRARREETASQRELEAPHLEDDSVDRLSADDTIDRLRREFHLRSADDPAFLAAALTFVSVTADDARVGRDCPRSLGHGSDPNEGPVLAALWYAGRHELFVGSSGRSRSTMAQQRRRVAQRFRARLTQLVGEVRGD